MITQAILTFFFNLLRLILGVLPDFSWSLDTSAGSYFFSIVSAVSYMLPMNTVVMIAGITIDLLLFRIIVSIFRTLWDLIPIL